MSHKIPGGFVICDEDSRKCELCGKVAECRPYGPNGEDICFECGMKNEEVTTQMFYAREGFIEPVRN